eukprot:TRINITY_DN14067_c0_g1_i2.p4 TRINITY_DN14067_c0_g1~~TRINITY_DN14067_c0_g1_i2.p4  ORF type:complete len:117 (+),score=1.91 TRINITY_DN14067_c0_g1_i2:341-691(+)
MEGSKLATLQLSNQKQLQRCTDSLIGNLRLGTIIPTKVAWAKWDRMKKEQIELIFYRFQQIQANGHMKLLFIACYSPLINNSAAIETLQYLNKLSDIKGNEVHLLTVDFPKKFYIL